MPKIDDVQLNDEVDAQLHRTESGSMRLVLRPLRPDVFYRTRDELTLTLREVGLILDLLQRNGLCPLDDPP